MKPEITQTICFNCAHLFQSSNEIITCPECSFTIERDRYEKLINYASDAVEFGYHYRQTYEDDLQAGELNVRHALVFDDIWIFAGLAALSGIIGNAAYDVLKIVIRKLREKRAEVIEYDMVQQALKNLENEEELRLFLQYILDYHNSLENVDAQVKGVIIEEMIIDVLLEDPSTADENIRSLANRKDRKRLLEKAIKQIASRERPTKADFKDFWKGLK